MRAIFHYHPSNTEKCVELDVYCYTKPYQDECHFRVYSECGAYLMQFHAPQDAAIAHKLLSVGIGPVDLIGPLLSKCVPLLDDKQNYNKAS